MKIGFIGTGEITKNVVLGIISSNLRIAKIFLSKKNKLISSKLKKKSKKIIITNNNQEIVDKCNWAFLDYTRSWKRL